MTADKKLSTTSVSVKVVLVPVSLGELGFCAEEEGLPPTFGGKIANAVKATPSRKDARRQNEHNPPEPLSLADTKITSCLYLRPGEQFRTRGRLDAWSKDKPPQATPKNSRLKEQIRPDHNEPVYPKTRP